MPRWLKSPPRTETSLSPVYHKLLWSIAGGVLAAFGLVLDIVRMLSPRP